MCFFKAMDSTVYGEEPKLSMESAGDPTPPTCGVERRLFLSFTLRPFSCERVRPDSHRHPSQQSVVVVPFHFLPLPLKGEGVRTLYKCLCPPVTVSVNLCGVTRAALAASLSRTKGHWSHSLSWWRYGDSWGSLWQ